MNRPGRATVAQGNGTAAGPGPKATQVGTASPSAQLAPGRPGRKEQRALAAAYMAIARPANRRLDRAVDGFGDSKRDDLAAAAADLRSEAATERWFDQRLLKIPLPAAIDTVATAMVSANPPDQADRPGGTVDLAHRAGVLHGPA